MVGRDELRTSVHTKADESVAANREFFSAYGDRLIDMAEALAEVFRKEGRLWTMGNGGSSSDAAHVAVEFNHPVTVGRPALPAHHLGADMQLMTALANDVGFREVFARQILALASPSDAVLGLSTSGNSENLLAAFEAAKRKGALTLAFVGGDGGRCRDNASVDYCLTVEHPSVHRVQECHVVAYHILWDLVHTLLSQDRRPEGGVQ
ncbi:MAG: SIS domain-containing protein [Myxococcota bacterium]